MFAFIRKLLGPGSDSGRKSHVQQQVLNIEQSANTRLVYANATSVHSRPREVLLFFEFQDEAAADDSPTATLVLNYFTAKRLSMALTQAIERHEAAFGALDPEHVAQAQPCSGPSYVNFARVSSTPEELILDVGINPTPYKAGNVTVCSSHVIILRHDVAAVLQDQLTDLIANYEIQTGPVEIDVAKRVKRA